MSRLKSAPGAKPGKAAKPAARPARSSAAGGAGGARGVYVQSPKSDIYVVLLGIAFGSILLGCILLLWIMYGYNFQLKPTVMVIPQGTIPLLANLSEKMMTATTVLL